MKRVILLICMALAVFAVITVTTACKSPPPPQEEETVDTTPPELSLQLSPQPFSPDGDGDDDVLTIKIGVKSVYPIYSWRIQILEPSPSYLLFKEWSGEGTPPTSLTWDGLSDDEEPELVQSASDYVIDFGVINIHNISGTTRETIHIDILVRREGDVLRVIVPSIVFAPNSGEFINGVSPETAENNKKILGRIAEVLGKYQEYKVLIEGHANPTTAPGTRNRTTEETKGLYRGDKGLKPLSEERAKAVMDYLVGLGVQQERLSSIGVGSARTLVEFADKGNWWKNRRVEFILEKPPVPVEPEADAEATE